MKKILEYFVRRRNPNFRFDPNLGYDCLLPMLFGQAKLMARGWTLLLLCRLPKGMLMGRRVRFRYLSTIRWGRFLSAGDFVLLSGMGKGGIQIGNHVRIGDFSRVIVSTSYNNIGEYIRIGDNVGIGEFAYLGGGGGLEIGRDSIIGQYFSCHPENHRFDNPRQKIRFQGVTRKGIKVGENCWIGAKVTLLDGTEIADGCIIAAGSVVRGQFPAGSVIGGVPARILRMRDDTGIAYATHSKGGEV